MNNNIFYANDDVLLSIFGLLQIVYVFKFLDENTSEVLGTKVFNLKIEYD